MKESQNTEWKESWRDDYLRWICGFANAEGGVLVIGRNDKGVVCGLPQVAKLLEDIPNKVRDILGIVVEVNLRWDSGLWMEFPFTPVSGVETLPKTREITREKILHLIAENPTISTADMATALGITRKGVEWQVRKLKTEGVLRRVGPTRGGHWEVLK